MNQYVDLTLTFFAFTLFLAGMVAGFSNMWRTQGKLRVVVRFVTVFLALNAAQLALDIAGLDRQAYWPLVLRLFQAVEALCTAGAIFYVYEIVEYLEDKQKK